MTTKFTNKFFNFSARKDLTAVIKSSTIISYNDLFDKSNHLAHSLSNTGIKKGDYVPLLIKDNLHFIQVTIALWILEAVPVPLNIKLLDEEIFSIVDDYNFKELITDKKFSGNSISGKLKIISFDELIVDARIYEIEEYPALNDEAVVIFTSGSTRRSKGVVHTFPSLINSIENGNEILRQNKNDRWLASLPFYHIGGFQILCRSLYYGCSIIIPESLQINHLADAIVNNKPTHLSLVSTQLERFIHQKVKPDESLKVSLLGGGFIDDELIFEADKHGWKPIRVYGSSETASMITAISAQEIKTKPQSVGKLFKNVELKISADSEILINSNTLFKYYLDDEKETSEALTNGFYHSGDLGFIDDNGYLFLEARRNDLIVTGGENVNPIEVEKAILQIEGIRDVCVFAKQDKTWGQIVAAAIVLTDSSIDERAIKDIIKQKLAGYKIPKKFFFVDELPRTALGKLEREKIRKSF